MKILSIHWGFSLGGVGKYAYLIDGVNNYAPVEIESLCVLSKNWQCDRQTLSKINAKEIIIKSRADISWVWRVINEIYRTNPDLIMTHGFNGHFVAILSKLMNHNDVPFICSYHGKYHATTIGRKFLGSLFNGITEYFIKHYALGVVAVAEYTKKYLIGKRVSGDKIEVIHNGIEDKSPPINARLAIRNQWNIEGDDILIGAASRLDPVKGVSYLIEAFSMISHEMPQTKMIIVGTGTQDAALKKKVKAHGLGNRVFFTGFRSNVEDFLAAFDVFVLPSLAEYHSIALLEAMRSEKAIIATDVGGNIESVRHEMEALIVPPGDSDALSDALKCLVLDDSFRHELSKNARQRFLNHFTVNVMVNKTAEWLLRCGRKASRDKALKITNP